VLPTTPMKNDGRLLLYCCVNFIQQTVKQDKWRMKLNHATNPTCQFLLKFVPLCVECKRRVGNCDEDYLWRCWGPEVSGRSRCQRRVELWRRAEPGPGCSEVNKIGLDLVEYDPNEDAQATSSLFQAFLTNSKVLRVEVRPGPRCVEVNGDLMQCDHHEVDFRPVLGVLGELKGYWMLKLDLDRVALK